MAISRRNCCLNAGFTLIEVLIAMAIIAIAMTAIIKTASQNIRATTHLQNKSMAMWLGQRVINEARMGVLPFSDQAIKENMSLFDRMWYVTAEKTITANKRIEKIEVDVYESEEATSASLVHLESYIYHDEMA